MRAVASASITFGLVVVPTKLYVTASEQKFSFNMLHKDCNGRVKQKYICPSCEVDVNRDETVKGYEHAKESFVVFSEEELKSLDEENRNHTIDILEFVPLNSVDLLQVQKSYYMAPDKGGDKAYKLLATVMGDDNKVAVGKWHTRGKDELVLVRAYNGGLLLHLCYYANEMRAFENSCANVPVSDVEKKLARQLISQLESPAFDAGKYHDEFAQRVAVAVQTKLDGKELVLSPGTPKAALVDLTSALMASVDASKKVAEVKETPKKLKASKKKAG